MTNSHTDCRTDEGIVVGLIDGIIMQARIIRKMGLRTEPIAEALSDFYADEDIAWIFAEGKSAVTRHEAGHEGEWINLKNFK